MMIDTRLPALPQPNSALGRPLDPRYASNIVVMLGSAAVLMATIVANAATGTAIPAVGVAGGVFLAWAVAREIDPDHNGAAYLAMVLGAVSGVFLGTSLLFGFGILITSRLLSATVGLALKRTDLLALVAIAALLGSGWASIPAVAPMAGAVLVADGPSHRARLTALASLVAAGLVFLITSPQLTRETAGGLELALGLVVLAALLATIPSSRIRSRTDVGGREIRAEGVTLARIGTACGLGLALVVGGAEGFAAAFGTAGVPLISVAVWHLAVRTRQNHAVELPV